MKKEIVIGIVLMLVTIGVFVGCTEQSNEINNYNLVGTTYGYPLIEEKDNNETTIAGFQTERPGYGDGITIFLWNDWRTDLRLWDIYGLLATWYGTLKKAWLYNNTVSITYRNLRGTDYIMDIIIE